MASGGLAIERDGPTLVVTIDNGDENLFSLAMLAELAGAVRNGARDADLRFVRLRASGEAFCLGREGASRAAVPARAVQAVAAQIVDLNELLQTSPLVAIAEVQGDAAGFGAGLVGSADIAVASENARFSFPEILAGYAATVVLGWLPYAVPRKRAFDMVATGAWLGAQTALADGLLTEVVARDRLETRVDERIAELGALDTTALRDIKRFLARTRSLDAATAAAASIDALALAIAGGDA